MTSQNFEKWNVIYIAPRVAMHSGKAGGYTFIYLSHSAVYTASAITIWPVGFG